MRFTASVPVPGTRTVAIGSVFDQRLLSVSADLSTAPSAPPGAGDQRIGFVTLPLIIHRLKL